ncbi:MAG: type II secretion system protein N [Pseudohongiella sp.]|nr:type II secretion system protein N [Pseudohongiella sp.]
MKLERFGSGSLTKATGLLLTAGFLAWSATHVAGMIWHVLAPDSELSASGNFSAYTSGFDRRSPVVDDIDLDRLQSVFVLSQMGQSSGVSYATDTIAGATDTRLALTLRGAVLSSDPSRSRAIIANADSQEGYQSGDRLLNTPGTVVLQEIHQTYVLLDNNGRTEILRMDEVVQTDLQSSPASSPEYPVTDSGAPATGAAGVLPAGINRNSALTELLRIQPVFEPADSVRAGALRGLQIRHGSSHDFLIAVGLERGDLITAVDGKQLDAAGDLPALMSQLSNQQSVSLQVLRDQATLNIVLDRSRW